MCTHRKRAKLLVYMLFLIKRTEYEKQFAQISALIPKRRQEIRETDRQIKEAEEELYVLKQQLQANLSTQRVVSFYDLWENAKNKKFSSATSM